MLVDEASRPVLVRGDGTNPAAGRESLSGRLFLSDSIVDKGRAGRNECAPSEETTTIAAKQIHKRVHGKFETTAYLWMETNEQILEELNK